MKPVIFRFIVHDETHTDEETLINGVWAVTRCDCELATKGELYAMEIELTQGKSALVVEMIIIE